LSSSLGSACAGAACPRPGDIFDAAALIFSKSIFARVDLAHHACPDVCAHHPMGCYRISAGRIEPLALSDKARMLILQRGQALRHLFEFV